MEAIRFDALTPADLEGALRLSQQAGWNQTPADWKRILDLSPAGCFAGRLGDRLVATSTAITYGRGPGWIGMVLVDEACRGRGYGAGILARAIEHCRATCGDAFGLDATDLGRPVYLKQGFVDVAPVDRWEGALAEAPPTGETQDMDRTSFDEVAALDRQACGADRSELLLHLLHEPDVAAWVNRREGRLAGFGFLRPGRQRSHFGPAVAEETGALAALLARASRRLEGARILLDAPRDPGVVGLLERSGLAVQRRLMRMTFARPQSLLLGDAVGALTAFEWG
jgi:GNAT superfamily N-acetyltransferase